MVFGFMMQMFQSGVGYLGLGWGCGRECIECSGDDFAVRNPSGALPTGIGYDGLTPTHSGQKTKTTSSVPRHYEEIGAHWQEVLYAALANHHRIGCHVCWFTVLARIRI